MVQYHTGDAAQACKVTLNTVRNWCRDYAQFLSPGASVTSGARVFSGRDMEVFKYIALLRAEGMQKGAIVQRLGETTFAEIDDSTDTTPTAIQNAPDASDSTPVSIVALHAITTLQRDVAALKASSQTPVLSQGEWFSGFGFGFVAALVFVVLLLLLFMLRHYL
jgi:DNA-binding transcriptional MerR regulator